MVRKSRKGREEWKTYKNVFDSFTEQNLFKLASQGYFEELKTALALGKEANIFIASTKESRDIIIKIYRLENCNFNKMHYYINSDPRFTGIENQKRKIIFSWVQREYRNLLLARNKIQVPNPIAFKDNIILMELIGLNEPAPMLKNKAPVDPDRFFKKIFDNIKKLLDVGIVHGDLSDFNILNHDEEPVFIDFSQATPIATYNAEELLERDLKNIFRTAQKLKLDLDEQKILDSLKRDLSQKVKK